MAYFWPKNRFLAILSGETQIYQSNRIFILNLNIISNTKKTILQQFSSSNTITFCKNCKIICFFKYHNFGTKRFFFQAENNPVSFHYFYTILISKSPSYPRYNTILESRFPFLMQSRRAALPTYAIRVRKKDRSLPLEYVSIK